MQYQYKQARSEAETTISRRRAFPSSLLCASMQRVIGGWWWWLMMQRIGNDRRLHNPANGLYAMW